MPLALGGLASTVLSNVIKRGVQKAVDKVADNKSVPEVKKADAAPVTHAIIDALAKDPAFVNATNSEPLIQSRVANGTVAAAVMAAGVVFMKWKAGEFDEMFFAALGAALAAGYAFLGRVLDWSKPMWSRVAGMLGK